MIATFGHHRNEISVAQAIGDVPAHAQNNDLGVELALHLDRGTILAFGHRAPPSARSLADVRCCTGTLAEVVPIFLGARSDVLNR